MEVDLVLTQKIEFIGAVLNSTETRAFLPENCFKTIAALMHSLRVYPTTTASLPETAWPHGLFHLCGATCLSQDETPSNTAGISIRIKSTLLGQDSDSPTYNYPLLYVVGDPQYAKGSPLQDPAHQCH